jgi:hypothetical protein
LRLSQWLERFCMGKFQTQKLIRPIVRKDVYLLETTFVLRLFKILSAPSRALASNIEKMSKEFKNLQFFLDFFKSMGPNVNAFKEKITVIDL